MRNRAISFLLLFFVFITAVKAQTKEEPKKEESKFSINVTGYVKTDILLDTRQNYALREGHFLLYPIGETKDAEGNDVFEKTNFNILPIQTRFNAKMTGPDAFSAKTSAVVEAEFFGTTDADINGFRLRHAFIKMDWDKTSLLFGQTWHPMFIAEMFPAVVSFNTGVPFIPFARSPQIRLTHSFGDASIMAALIAQRDFASNGPSGFTSSYMRNAVIPNTHIQFQYKSGENLFGFAGDYKILMPRTLTTKNIKTSETISSMAALGFMKVKLDPVTFKVQGIYGQNLSDLLMLGGYAVKSTNTTTAEETYTNISSYSVWGELLTGKEIETGIFFGYSKYLGAADNITGASYINRLDAADKGKAIDNVFRVAPRVQFNSGKMRFSAELEYTSAGYGTPVNNDMGKVKDITSVANIRLLLAAWYFF